MTTVGNCMIVAGFALYAVTLIRGKNMSATYRSTGALLLLSAVCAFATFGGGGDFEPIQQRAIPVEKVPLWQRPEFAAPVTVAVITFIVAPIVLKRVNRGRR